MHQRHVTTEFSMDRVVPFFQPIIDIASNKVWRYECLARLLGESEHIFLPAEFLYIVDRNKANTQLTHHIYTLGHQYCKEHQLPWSINLSSADLSDEYTLNWLIKECNSQQHALLGLEISFSDASTFKAEIRKLVKSCKSLSVSIDDVDAINDELIDLLKIGVDALKLRGSYAQQSCKDEKAANEILKLVKVCDDYQTKLVAEHIEDQSTLDNLRDLGLKYGQGYFFSSPSAAATLAN